MKLEFSRKIFEKYSDDNPRGLNIQKGSSASIVFNFRPINSWLCRLNIYFMKIRPVGAESFHSDRRTDMKKLIDTFRNFAKASKNGLAKVRSCFLHCKPFSFGNF